MHTARDEIPVSDDYRPLCKLALVALAVTLLGTLSLLSGKLLALPLVGTALAVLALRQIGKSDVPLAGVGMARLSLALGAFCLASLAGHTMLHRQLLIRGARQNAQYWLQLVAEDRIFEAHQMTKPQRERQRRNIDLNDHYRDWSEDEKSASAEFPGGLYPLKELNEMFGEPPLREVAAALKGGDTAQLVRALNVFYRDEHDVVDLLYRLTGDQAEFVVRMRRDRDRVSRRTSWRTAGVIFESEAK